MNLPNKKTTTRKKVKPKKGLTAKNIQKYLSDHFAKNSKYVVPNIYYFHMDIYYESDLLIFKQNGSIYEIEIKISKQDFLADFKKGNKHLCLEEGSYPNDKKSVIYRNKIKYEPRQMVPIDRPNRFYFAVPHGMVKPDELPDYAGLFWITLDGKVTKVKEGKLLKKERFIDFEKLANKFYWFWMNSKKKI